MTDAAELFRAYIASIHVPEKAAALFAADGAVELPYLNARTAGPEAMEAFLAGILRMMPDFKLKNLRVLIETPEQAFGEYEVECLVPSTGKIYKQLYFGRLVAENGKIKLLREALDTRAVDDAFAAAPPSER